MAIIHGFSVLLIFCTVLTPLSLGANVLIDPTRPATGHKTISSDPVGVVVRSWTLESTLVAPDRRVAVINGKLVSEGESVDGAQVLTIRKLNVLVQTSDGRVTLQLLPDIVKKKP